jgi:opacity protein-like surface antigen
LRRTILIAAVLAISGSSSVLLAGDWSGNVNAFLGVKMLDKDDWEPLEEQSEVGILFDIGKNGWPVNILIESMYSTQDEDAGPGTENEVTTIEAIIGVRKIWAPNSTIRPFIGGGLCVVTGFASTEQEYVEITENASGIGFSIGGGVYWTIAQHFNLGLDARYSSAEATFNDIDSAIGGVHSGLILGYHW